uniref:Putative secreted protein n=1 Tax=Anopheles darlingi TaxID=43151 RepID=A0A2M4DEE4_ANODA
MVGTVVGMVGVELALALGMLSFIWFMSGVGVLGTGDIFGTLVMGSLLIVDTEVDSCSRLMLWYILGTADGDSDVAAG